MATTKGQRIGIWVIAGMMFLGTVGGFVAMMVAPGNEAKDQAAFKKAQDEYTKATDERKKKVEAQANELSQKYYGKFSEFSSRVGAFEAGDVKELVKEDLVEVPKLRTTLNWLFITLAGTLRVRFSINQLLTAN